VAGAKRRSVISPVATALLALPYTRKIAGGGTDKTPESDRLRRTVGCLLVRAVHCGRPLLGAGRLTETLPDQPQSIDRQR